MVVDVIYNREVKFGDRYHIARLGGIRQAGWNVYWAPLTRTPLHVRMIPDELYYDPEAIVRKEKKERLLREFQKLV